MEAVNTTTTLVRFEELPVLLQDLPKALELNTNLYKKVEARIKSLLDTIEAEGMSKEIDAECNDVLVLCREASKRMNTRRTPYTKLVTLITSEFTNLENPLDQSKKESLSNAIQKHRDTFAKSLALEQQRKEQEIQQQRNIANEKIQLVAKIQQAVKDKYNQILLNFKRVANDKFNALTLPTWDAGVAEIKALRDSYPRDKFNEIAVTVTSIYMQPAELAPLIFDTRAALYNELSADFKEHMEALKQHLVDQLPARKSELVDMDKASASEKKRLQDEADRRQKAEEMRIANEASELQKQSEAQTQLSLSVAQADVAFEAENKMAEVREENTAQVRQGYNIIINTAAGYQQIAAFWFNKWGAITPIDKLEKKSLGQMKSDCEKHAHATGEKIESQHLQYEQEFKAVIKKIN